MLKDLALQLPPLRRLYDSRNSLQIAYDLAQVEKATYQAELAAAKKEAVAARSPFWHYSSTFDAVDAMHRCVFQPIVDGVSG